MGSYKKKLFIVLLVILLIEFFACGSVNATTTEDNYNYNLLVNNQENLAKIFFNQLDNYSSVTVQQDVMNLIKYKRYNHLFTFNNSGSSYYISLILIPYNINWQNLSLTSGINLEWNENFYSDAYNDIDISGYQFSKTNINNQAIIRIICYLGGNGVTSSSINRDYTGVVFVPSLLINYQNITVNNYINGISPSNTPFTMIFNAIQENTEQQEETTNEMKELNNFMKSEDVDQDAYDMPTNNPTQDPTTDGINNIFNKFYTRITSWDSSNIQVFIPFANKSFWINANTSEQLLNKFSNMGLGSTLKSLISAVWFYVLARYIIKDVQKYVDGLKTGEILTKSDTNIKTEML